MISTVIQVTYPLKQYQIENNSENNLYSSKHYTSQNTQVWCTGLWFL